jgi:hypothetical protein
MKNLAIHRTSKACQSRQGDKRPKRTPGQSKAAQPNHDLRAFFKPRAPLNPPTVVAPPPIHTDETSFSALSKNLENELGTLETHKKKAHQETPAETQVEMGVPIHMDTSMDACVDTGKTPCRKGVELLNKLEAAVTRIPDNVPLATPAHRLSVFSVDPHSWVVGLEQDPEVEFEDDWMALNSMLKTAFGWGESEMRGNVKEMLNRGEYGLDGFIHFFKYFVLRRGLEGAMIEPKVDGLLCEIDNQ